MHDEDSSPSASGAAGVALERLFELATLIDDAIDQGLAEQGLTRARAEVVWRLQHLGPMTHRQLSEALQCSPRNVTGLVDALEDGGMVSRGPHPTDRRASLVSLTEAGARSADDWQSGFGDLGAALFDDLAPGDVERLAAILEQVLPRLRERIAPTPIAGAR